MVQETVLDELERRIVAALQIDGRAPWRRIARVLGESERTVARRGADLLARGVVRVSAIRIRPRTALLRLECSPGGAQVAAEALARRPDTTFCYLMTGGADVVAEVALSAERLDAALITQLPATPGLVRMVSYPVLRYYRTVRGWRAGGLSGREADGLAGPLTADAFPAAVEDLAARDLDVVAVLTEDGRAPVETIARRVGVSEATAARRVERLLRSHQIQIRALVEPRAVGLPVEALLWIEAPPSAVDRIGQALQASPQVRYAAAVAGPHQIVAHIAVADLDAVHRFSTDDAWARDVTGLDIGLLLRARARGGQVLDD